MYTVGEMVKDLQLYDSDLAVEDLFQSPEFTSRIMEVVKSLPVRSKRSVRGIIRGMKMSGTLGQRSAASEEALRAIWKTRSIAFPTSLTDLYEKWQRDPSTFWNWQGFRVRNGNILHIYSGMKQLETQRHSGTIIWRFFTLFFYDLLRLLGEGRKYMVETLQDKLVRAIDTSGLLVDSTKTIHGDLKRWASAGSKYHNIGASLGTGALMLIPQEVTDNIWESRLPMKGGCFEDAMNHLVGLGIRDVSEKMGADALGSEVRELILKPFRSFDSNQPDLGMLVSVNCETSIVTPNRDQLEVCPPQVPQSAILDSTSRPSASRLGPNVEQPVQNKMIATQGAAGLDWWDREFPTSGDMVIADAAQQYNSLNRGNEDSVTKMFAEPGNGLLSEEDPNICSRVDMSIFNVFQPMVA